MASELNRVDLNRVEPGPAGGHPGERGSEPRTSPESPEQGLPADRHPAGTTAAAGNGGPPDEDDGVERWKIGEFARLAGTSTQTLRYYEATGLLSPTVRSRGRFRFYRTTDVNRIHAIRSLQRLGLSLEQIRELLPPRDEALPRQAIMDRVLHGLSRQDELLSEEMRELANRRQHIRQALAKLESCRQCGIVPGLDNNYCEPCQRDGQVLPDELSALF